MTTDSAAPTVTRAGSGWSERLFPNVVAVGGAHRTIYLSGLADNDPTDGHVLNPGDFEAQCRGTFARLRDVLATQGLDLGDIVKITAYVTQPEYVKRYTACRLEAFGDAPLSTHTLVVVRGLAFPEMLVEVDATAVAPA